MTIPSNKTPQNASSGLKQHIGYAIELIWTLFIWLGLIVFLSYLIFGGLGFGGWLAVGCLAIMLGAYKLSEDGKF